MNNENNVSDLLNTDLPKHSDNRESYESTNLDDYDSPSRVSIMDKVRLCNLFLFFDSFFRILISFILIIQFFITIYCLDLCLNT